jgi:predicted AAA+ superfamily ATPase
MLIERDLASRLHQGASTRPSLILTGARQVGKTTLLRAAFPEAEYVTFDSLLAIDSAREAPEAFLDRFSGPVILDEVQYVPELFMALKRKIDQDRDATGRWLLTGSQRFELMKGISESLAGRIAIFHLEPLSAREIRRSPDVGKERVASIVVRGGYPELWKNPRIEAAQWFEDYIRTYIERDLRSLIHVKSLVEFRRFLGLAAARAGGLVNYSDLGQAAGVSNNTVKTWIAALEASGIIYMLPPYFANAEKRLVKLPKLFFADSGLLAALLGIETDKELRANALAGHLWENFVLTELIKTDDAKPGRNLFFYRDHSGVEVDFVLTGKRGLSLIEAKFSERIREERLPFELVATRLGATVNRRAVAAPTGRPESLPMGTYEIYDPRYAVYSLSAT